MSEIFGRQEEIKILEAFHRTNAAQFLAVCGRRRIGKTFLIRNFFNKNPHTLFFVSTGLKGPCCK